MKRDKFITKTALFSTLLIKQNQSKILDWFCFINFLL